jgi:hypothetical protein
MPFSWVRVPSNTSHKIRECAGDDHTKVRFKAAVEEVVANDGGGVDKILFEGSGKYAHVHISWDTIEQKRNIVLDLEATEVVDLYEAEEIDELIAERQSGS